MAKKCFFSYNSGNNKKVDSSEGIIIRLQLIKQTSWVHNIFFQNGYSLPDTTKGEDIDYIQEILPVLEGTSYFLSRIITDWLDDHVFHFSYK